MKILLTNDDGITSQGILLLASALRNKGHRVLVMAPATDQSGVSHSISFLRAPCKIKQICEDTFSCAGTPVDCVTLSLLGVFAQLGIEGFTKDAPSEFDLVLSGINCGPNLGTDILFSGTAAAARQAALREIPSIALSLTENKNKEWHWETAVNFAVENLQEILTHWKKDSFLNINIPNNKEIAGFKRAFPSFRHYNDYIDVYENSLSGTFCFVRLEEPDEKVNTADTKKDKISDWNAVNSGYASLSAIYIHPALLEDVQI